MQLTNFPEMDISSNIQCITANDLQPNNQYSMNQNLNGQKVIRQGVQWNEDRKFWILQIPIGHKHTTREIQISSQYRYNNHTIIKNKEFYYIGVHKYQQGSVIAGLLSTTQPRQSIVCEKSSNEFKNKCVGIKINGQLTNGVHIEDNLFYSGGCVNKQFFGFGTLIQKQSVYRGYFIQSQFNGYGVSIGYKTSKFMNKGYYSQNRYKGLGIYVDEHVVACGYFIQNQLIGSGSLMRNRDQTNHLSVGLHQKSAFYGHKLTQEMIPFPNYHLFWQDEQGYFQNDHYGQCIRRNCSVWTSKSEVSDEYLIINLLLKLECVQQIGIIQVQLFNSEFPKTDIKSALNKINNNIQKQISPRGAIERLIDFGEFVESTYEGQFHNGKKHGFGIIQFKVCEKSTNCCQNSRSTNWLDKHDFCLGFQSQCKGIWVNGQITSGIISFLDKGLYNGQIKDGQFHGEGIYENKVKKIKIEGTWQYNKLITGNSDIKIQDQRQIQRKDNGIVIDEKGKRDNGYVFQAQYPGPTRQGYGSIYLSNQLTYQGQVYNGLPHGKGTIHPLIGDPYEAYLVNGVIKRLSLLLDDGARVNVLYIGKNRYITSITYVNGEQYVGQYDEDSRNGTGTMIRKINYLLNVKGLSQQINCKNSADDTYVYCGDFKNDQFDGYGILKNDFITYQGTWNGSMQLNGIIQLPNGQIIYEGEILHLRRHGWGKVITSDGNIYEGKWIKGALTFGSHTNSDKKFYFKGQYKFDQPHGQGLLVWYVKGVNYREQFIKLITEGIRISNLLDREPNFMELSSASTQNQQIYKYEYKGGFINGQLFGIGNLSSEGIIFYGGFLKNIMHGQCRVIYNNKEFIGRRERGVKQGRQQVYNQDIFQEDISFIDGIRRYLEQ